MTCPSIPFPLRGRGLLFSILKFRNKKALPILSRKGLLLHELVPDRQAISVIPITASVSAVGTPVSGSHPISR